MTTLKGMLLKGQAFKSLKCEAPGCAKNRPGLSPLCTGHQLKRSRYGHPLGKSIPLKDYRGELNEVKAFFVAHSDHPAIKAAEVFFDRWIQQAGRQEAQIGQGILVRLHGHVIPPVDVVTEVSAIWLYAHRHPHDLPEDNRLTFALARGVLRLAGYERRTYGESNRVAIKQPRMGDLKATGEHIRQSLARFFVNLVPAINAKADEAKAIKNNLATPFI